MTKVLFNIGQDTIYGVYGVDTLVTAKAATRRISGDMLITRDQLRETDSKPFTIDLAPTSLGQAWIITVSPDNGDTFTGYYKVPAGETVNFTDLIEVDPDSLEPTDDPEPEWWAVANSTINSGKVVDDRLILTRNDGVEVDAGNVRGLPGKDGVDGDDGAPGRDGVNGAPGRDGVSVVYTEINVDGDLLVTLSNDQVVNAGRARGRDGVDGVDGADGVDGTDGADAPVTIAYVKDFGAKGDNSTDDTLAIQAAVDSLHSTNFQGGGKVVFDYGVNGGSYLISSPIVINKPGVTLESTGGYTATIKPTANFVGSHAVIFAIPNTIQRGIRVTNMQFYMLNTTAGAILMESAYDNVILENVFVAHLGGNANGIEFRTAAGVSSTVSQTISAINCFVFGRKTGATPHTGHAWHVEDVQEAVFTSCKGLAGGETSGVAWYVKGCRGVAFYGCSAAFAETGFVLDASGRGMLGITIDAPTLESLSNSIKTFGANSVNYFALRNPRSQVGDTLAAGPITLSNCHQSMLETHNIEVTLQSTTSQMQIITNNRSKVVDNGQSTSIIQWSNGAGSTSFNKLSVENSSSPEIELRATGRSGRWKKTWNTDSSGDYGIIERWWNGTNHVNSKITDAAGGRHRFYVEGVETGGFSKLPAAGSTSLWMHNGVSLVQVSVGEPDSAGTGFRVLRIEN